MKKVFNSAIGENAYCFNDGCLETTQFKRNSDLFTIKQIGLL
ncbi:hypothetical protein MKZ26_21820 [Sporosarcina sp. FSL K6-6792]